VTRRHTGIHLLPVLNCTQFAYSYESRFAIAPFALFDFFEQLRRLVCGKPFSTVRKIRTVVIADSGLDATQKARSKGKTTRV
ncbi:MAG: hypothetical protein ACRD3W_29530, partial [Terriglobales bacterium]